MSKTLERFISFIRRTVVFSQGEIYTGLLILMFGSTLEREARPAFEEMNRALKRSAEQ